MHLVRMAKRVILPGTMVVIGVFRTLVEQSKFSIEYCYVDTQARFDDETY